MDTNNDEIILMQVALMFFKEFNHGPSVGCTIMFSRSMKWGVNMYICFKIFW